MLNKGLVQVYTGDGKGKTTAAFGLALRAAGRGNKVLIYQFLKPASLELGERLAMEHIELPIKVKAFGAEWDMFESFRNEEVLHRTRAVIKKALAEIALAAEKRVYDCVILDEIVFCLSKGLARLEDVKDIIDRRHKAVELVLTGRGASEELIKLADLVTEMRKLKHPFDDGIKAREGIEY
jgi:cob(I)alamin adenosyltransferase